MAPRGRPKKDPFEALESDFKNLIENLPSEDVKKKVAEVAFELDRLMEAKKADQDLAEKTEAAKDAGAIYREGAKMAKLRIRYASMILEARGKA